MDASLDLEGISSLVFGSEGENTVQEDTLFLA